MNADEIRAELCSLNGHARIHRCREMLQDPELQGENRSRVLYFLAYDLRQPGIDEPDASLAAVEEALSGGPISADLWEKFRTTKGLDLYDLGRLGDIPPVLDELEAASISPTAAAYVQALRGVCRSYACDPAAFALLDMAEHFFADHHFDMDAAWVQRSGASLALKLRDYASALNWSGRVSYGPQLPAGKLLEAESLYRLGHQDDAINLVNRVRDGEFGAVPPDAEVRRIYLEALFAWDNGDSLQASRLITRADLHLSTLPRRAIDLGAAVAELRTQLIREEVA